MNASKTLFCALSVLGSSLAATAQETLFYTTLQEESSFCVLLPALDAFNPRDVICVEPNPAGAPCAEKFLPANGLLTLVGDENNDSSIWEESRPKAIDALQWRPNTARRTARHLYFSTATDLDDCVSMGGDFLDGDIGRIEADGKYVKFLTEAQIKSAFDMPTEEEINVDAFTLDEVSQRCYLSFEDTETVDTVNAGVVTIDDGAIVCIPLAMLGEPSTVVANSGLLVALEAQVDNLVANSAVWDRSGAPAVTIGDLDGLELEAGNYTNAWGNWNNFCFTGEDLTGGIVLSTTFFGGTPGSVHVMNGQPLGQVGSTTPGRQVGLFDGAPNAGSLNALESAWSFATRNFVLDTPTPEVTAGMVAEVEIGGASPGGAWLLIGVDVDAPCIVHPILATLPNPCFPDLMQFQGAFGPIPVNAAGQGSFSLPIPAISGFDLVFQGVGSGPTGFELSTPITIEIL